MKGFPLMILNLLSRRFTYKTAAQMKMAETVASLSISIKGGNIQRLLLISHRKRGFCFLGRLAL